MAELTAFEQEMKQTLLAKRESLLDKIAKHNEDFKIIAQSMVGKDAADLADNTIAFKKLESINYHDANQLRAIENSLRRIKAGCYGVCLSCGKKIPEDRLRAMPSAVLCVECKTKQEAGN